MGSNPKAFRLYFGNTELQWSSYPGCQGLLFWGGERSERATRRSRVKEARSAEKKSPSRLPSEPAKRLIFSPTIRQRASGTRVWSSYLYLYSAVHISAFMFLLLHPPQIYYKSTRWSLTVPLLAQAVKALHRCCRGHGRSWVRIPHKSELFFQVLFSQLFKLLT